MIVLKKKSVAILLLFCFCSLLFGCSSARLSGTWAQENGTSVTSMTFNEDNTGNMSLNGQVVYNFTYETKGSSVTIVTQTTEDHVTNTYHFKVKDEQLILTKDNGDRIVLTAK